MDKTKIKNFAVWARKKLIDEITYKAVLLGITKEGILEPLPQSTAETQLFNIGINSQYSVNGAEIMARRSLVREIESKAEKTDYKTAFDSCIEETAYTWFNRIIAVRFMEVNNYLPVRVLSSESEGKQEPDIVTFPQEAGFEYTDDEIKRIAVLKRENRLDELFNMLFIKQCNALSSVFSGIFEKKNDYSELLLNVSFTNHDGIIYRLTHSLDENDFKVRSVENWGNCAGSLADDGEKAAGQVEVIGWLYQYYNDERKNQVVNIYKGTVKKEDIPAATQIFTTKWVVRYMVDNSLGLYWLERNPDSPLKNTLEYLLEDKITPVNEKISPEDLKILDPCMGSGHILVYAFDVLMEIYKECGYNSSDAAKSIIENNLYGFDIDERACQLAYFSVLMKARQYNRHILEEKPKLHLYSFQDTDDFNRKSLRYFGADITEKKQWNKQKKQIEYILDTFKNAKEYGSLINIDGKLDFNRLHSFVENADFSGQLSFDEQDSDVIQRRLRQIVEIAKVMSQKYNVVVTNPPYLNKMDEKLRKFVSGNYKDYSGDLFSVFIYRNFDFCKNNGYSAFMTPYVWMFNKTYEKLRKYIIAEKSVQSLIQMEYSAFDEATVPICAFVLKNAPESKDGTYIRLSGFKGGMEVQRQKAIEAIKNRNCGYLYKTSARNFSRIPETRFSFWGSSEETECFEKGKQIGEMAFPKQGLATGDNNRFLRLWHEVAIQNIGFDMQSREQSAQSGLRWFPYNKGGGYRKWYGNNEYVIDWRNDGEALRKFKGSVLRSQQFYFKKCLSWCKVTSGGFSMRYIPQGFLFDVAGCSLFMDDALMKYALGYMNSRCNAVIIGLLSNTINYEVGHVAQLPLIIDSGEVEHVNRLVGENIEICKDDWDSFETSWDFKKHPFITFRTDSGLIADAFALWRDFCDKRFNLLKSNEKELNEVFIRVYGLEKELSQEVDSREITVRRADLSADVRLFISYAVGCMFGRYSLDKDGLAFCGGDWNEYNSESAYKTYIPAADNIIPITDEEYFKDDIVGRFAGFVEAVFGAETLEQNLGFIANALGGSGASPRGVIRNYFLCDFFKDHCRLYKKRPIYWLFDSGRQNGFKALIYMHRYSADTIGKLRIDYLLRIQRTYESEINILRQGSGNLQGYEAVKAEKRIEKLKKQLKEVMEYDEKIAHLALCRTEIDLDDGVKYNYDKIQTGKDGKNLGVLAVIS